MRHHLCFAAAAIIAATISASPSVAQSIAVYGDPGGSACFDAASAGDNSLSALQQCDLALSQMRLIGRDRTATHINRAIIRGLRGDHVGAHEDYLEARRAIPDLPESFVGEGNVAFIRGDFAAALSHYDRALELGLNDAHAGYFNRGLALERLGRPREAATAYQRALEYRPGWDIAEANLARVTAPAQTN